MHLFAGEQGTLPPVDPSATPEALGKQMETLHERLRELYLEDTPKIEKQLFPWYHQKGGEAFVKVLEGPASQASKLRAIEILTDLRDNYGMLMPFSLTMLYRSSLSAETRTENPAERRELTNAIGKLLRYRPEDINRDRDREPRTNSGALADAPRRRSASPSGPPPRTTQPSPRSH